MVLGLICVELGHKLALMSKKIYNFFMIFIRKLSFWDKNNVKKMISFLGNDEAEMFVNKLLKTSCGIFHYWLPLRFKFLSESYVLVDDTDLHGMVSVAPFKGNPYKINFVKLLFKKDYYDIGKQLVEFIIARYGAKGAQSFVVAIDDSHDELIKLFIEGCGFRKCASEELWRIKQDEIPDDICLNGFRQFKNSDAQAVAMLFNDSLITHFKPSLLKTKNEYNDILFAGLPDDVELKYVLEDSTLQTIMAYFSVKTYDNTNYIVDITVSNGITLDYDLILGYVKKQIMKRQKIFTMFVKLKKYVQHAETFENYLKIKNFRCVKNQIILFKDFYKLIKQENINHEVVLFTESGSRPVFKVQQKIND